jgi:hypothetical protein
MLGGLSTTELCQQPLGFGDEALVYISGWP